MLKIEKNDITWINLDQPTANDILTIKGEFGLGRAVVNQIPIPIKRPKIEEYHNCLFLVLHFPVFDEKTRQTNPTELDFIISPSKIITIYQEPLPQLENLCHECLSGVSNENGEYFKSAGHLLFFILDKLMDSCLPMLDHIQEHIENIEDNTFKGHEREMLKEIAIVKRDLIDFRKTIKPQRSVLELLAKKAPSFFDQDLEFASQEVIGSNIRVWNTLENHKELIESIEKTNDAFLSYKINNILKTLTLLSFVTFPLSLLAAIFSMEVPKPEFLSRPYIWWEILAGMFIGVTCLFILFKKKKWL